MDMKKLFIGGLLAAALVPWSAGAVVLNTDMTFDADGGFGDLNGVDADGSAGEFSGNDPASGQPPYSLQDPSDNDLFGGGWVKVAKSDEAGGVGSFDGLDFVITDLQDGDWQITWSDPAGGLSLPNVLDFAFSIKQANSWAAWYFEAVRITAGNTPNGGTYSVNWSGDGLDISHFSLWLRDSETPDEIPLPGAVWLFGSALVGLVTLHRRRRLAA